MLKRIIQFPIIRELYARSLLFPAVVLLVVAVVLLQGALHETLPKEATTETKPPPLQIPTMRPSLEKTPLAYSSDYWLQVAGQSRRRLMLIGREQVSAVVVSPGIALSSARAAEYWLAEELERELEAAKRGDATEEGTNGDLDVPSNAPGEAGPKAPANDSPGTAAEARYRLLGIDPQMGLAVFELQKPYAASAFPWADPETVTPGSHAAAISLSPAAAFHISPGVVASPPPKSSRESDSFDAAIAFGEQAGAAAIVDLDGLLLGVAVESQAGMRVFSLDAANRAVERLRNAKLCRAIEPSEIGNDLRAILQIEGGVLVAKVLQDVIEATPPIRPGDVVLEWGGKAVESVGQFHSLYQQQEPFGTVAYVVLRGSRRIRGKARLPGPHCLSTTEPITSFARLGVVLKHGLPPQSHSDLGEGWRVLGVLDSSPASAAGLTRDDWIVAVQGQPATSRNARRSLENFERRPRPMVLTVQRGSRVRLLAIQPPAQDDSSASPSKPG